jgi:hypothetical protein
MKKSAKKGQNDAIINATIVFIFVISRKKHEKNSFYCKFSHISVGLYHQLMPNVYEVIQLLDVVPGGLHGRDPLDAHGELGHRVNVQQSLSLILSHTSTP